MLETPHVAVGAAIATKIPNPYIAIPLSFLSHLVLEKVPHWNPHIYTEMRKYGKVTRKSRTIIVVDAFLALFLGSYLASRVLPNTSHALTILFSCFASVFPDVVEIPYYFFKNKWKLLKKWIDWERSIQCNAEPLIGNLTQIITIFAAIVWIYF